MLSIEELLRRPILELRKSYLDGGGPVPPGLLEGLECDDRRGARVLASRLRARRDENLAELRRLKELFRIETELFEEGYRLIAGVDEAGIGPMAGPVVAGAVILPADYKLEGLDDSKKLDESTRERLAGRIKAEAVAWACGTVCVEEIDRLNIYRAGLLAMKRAIEALDPRPDYVLVDARTIPECPAPQRGIIRGDSLSASIAAGSILAKTTRDALMLELDREFPGYGFASHKGYATEAHFRALRSLGPLPVHRRSFRPVREAVEEEKRNKRRQGMGVRGWGLDK